MKLTLLSMWLALPLAAQITASFTPYPLAATNRAFANGRELGLWEVRVCSGDAVQRVVARERILDAAPTLRVIRNDLALDILGRRSSGSFWATAGRIGTLVLQHAPAAISLWGASTGDTGLARGGAIGGLSLGLLQLGVSRASERAPDPGRYERDFLPDLVTLGPEGCGDYLIASGLVRGADAIGPVPVMLAAQRRDILAKVLAARRAAGFEVPELE